MSLGSVLEQLSRRQPGAPTRRLSRRQSLTLLNHWREASKRGVRFEACGVTYAGEYYLMRLN